MDQQQQHDPTTEQALLGALLLNPTLIPQITNIINPQDLYDTRHQTIYTTITTIAPLAPPGPIDPLLIAHALAHNGQLKQGHLDGPYLHTCLSACTNPLSAPTFAHQIRTEADNRTLHHIAARLHHTATLDNPHQRATTLAELRTQLEALDTGNRNGRHPHLQPAHTYRIKAVKWIWDTRIPIGEITLISGREGVGKSIFLAWLAAAITNGNLQGHWHGHPRAVLYAAAEDSWEYTIAPRMLAAGANLDLIYRIDIAEPDGTHTGINLPHDIHHLPAAVRQADAAALLLDPLLSVLDDEINVFKAPEVRAVLQPLRAAAETTGIAIIGLAHYNKTKHADSNSMVANSRAFLEVARAAIAIARDDDADEYTCVLSQAKNNLGTLDTPSLNYTIDDVTLETDDGEDAHIGRLRWTGEAEITADQLLTGTAGDRPLGDNAQAILDWIENQPPPVTVQEVATHFKDDIKYETVKKILARLARSGRLLSPNRGLYQPTTKPVRNRRPGRNQPPKSPDPPTPSKKCPHVPNTPPNYTKEEVGGGIEREEGVSLELSLGTDRVSPETETGIDETGTLGTLGTGDRGSRVGAGARESTTEPAQRSTLAYDEDEREEWWKK